MKLVQFVAAFSGVVRTGELCDHRPSVKTDRITILGTGNAGVTAAYHFGRRGADVCLCGAPGFDAPLSAIRAAGGIRALEQFGGATLTESGHQPVALLSTDPAEALAFADLLVMPVPSFAQEALFREMLPHLRDGQLILLMPGNFGSFALTRLKNELGYEALNITFVDAISIPWACRLLTGAEIAIFGVKKYLPVAAFPASRTAVALAAISSRFPVPLVQLENVIAAGLDNINFGGHPLMTLLSIGLLENFPGRFNYYRDCCSPATARAAEVLDAERLAVGRALGLKLVPELDAMNGLYGLECSSVYEFNRSSGTHGAIQGAPESSGHRYLAEDVPFLMVPALELGRLAGVATPVIESCACLAGALNGVDYLDSGRTLRRMGLSGLTVEQIREFATTGVRP